MKFPDIFFFSVKAETALTKQMRCPRQKLHTHFSSISLRTKQLKRILAENSRSLMLLKEI